MIALKIYIHLCVLATFCCINFPVISNAQSKTDAALAALQQPANGKGLFDTDAVLEITLSGNVKELLNDRAENSQCHPMLLSYKGEDSNAVVLPVTMKTRGHFRKLKENCYYPPLQISFSKNDQLYASVFQEQEKLKLVMPCSNDAYVIREWLVYQLYNLVTPQSFKARLVKVKLEDPKSKKAATAFLWHFAGRRKANG